jgi:hypothetical protein
MAASRGAMALVIPLSSAAGYLMIKSIAGTCTRLAAVPVPPAFTCKPAERKNMTAVDRMLARSLRKTESRRFGRRWNHPERMRIPAAK